MNIITLHPKETNAYKVTKRSNHVIAKQCGPNSASAVCRIMILQLSELERPCNTSSYCQINQYCVRQTKVNRA